MRGLADVRRIEVGCSWCGRTHVVKSLAKTLYCCSVSYGLRKLVVEIAEKDGGRCFELTEGTTLRVVTKDGTTKRGYRPPVSPNGKRK